MISGLHIEPTNICTLKCSGCARTRFINRWPQHWKNQSIDIDQLMKFIDIDLDGLPIWLCGNYGDPIYHPRFHELVSALKSRGATLKITTNGSYKSPDWWHELCKLLTKLDSIEFSIDGTPDNFTIYRQNADWASIKHGLEVCAQYPIKKIWKYIPFSYNQKSIDEARKIAEQFNIDEFQIEPSDRFDETTQHLLPDPVYISQLKTYKDLAKKGQIDQIDPQCNSNRDHFINATGHYYPCCFTADHRFTYKNWFGQNQDQTNIDSTTLSGLLKQSKIVEWYQNMQDCPEPVCQFSCPRRT